MRVGLVMIVKDEEAVLERALRSALPWITTWVIVDTGSTDGTRGLVRRVLADIPGILFDRTWVNFGANRTEALQLCRGRMDWAIMLDADDELAGPVPPPAVFTDALDGLRMRIQHGSLWHQRIQLFRIAADWSYKGAVHEFPVCRSGAPRIGILPAESYMITRCEGARSRDPQKYTKDAAILEAALVENPGDSRTLFYLAQSYRDAGNREEARRVYGAYLDLSEGVGWNQERYMAIVNLIGLEDDSQDQMDLAWKAVELCPDRLEAPYTLLRRRRLEGRPVLRQTYALASVCRNRKVAADWLFATPAVYEWGMDDELAVVAFALGHYQEAYDAAMRCVLNGPAETRENAMRNARAALNKMQGLP